MPDQSVSSVKLSKGVSFNICNYADEVVRTTPRLAPFGAFVSVMTPKAKRIPDGVRIEITTQRPSARTETVDLRLSVDSIGQTLSDELKQAIRNQLTSWSERWVSENAMSPAELCASLVPRERPTPVQRAALLAALKEVSNAELPAFRYGPLVDGPRLPLVVAAAFPMMDVELLGALLERGVGANTPLPAAVALNLQVDVGTLRPGEATDESFEAGATALDVVARAEQVLRALQKKQRSTAKDPYVDTKRKTAVESLPKVRALLEARGARPGAKQAAARPSVPAKLEPVLRAIELLAECARVPVAQLHDHLASVSADGGPFSYFASAVKDRLLDTDDLRRIAADHPLWCIASGAAGEQASDLSARYQPDPLDEGYDPDLGRWLPTDGFSPKSRKLLSADAHLVGGSEQGYWIIRVKGKATELWIVRPDTPERIAADFARWVLEEAEKLRSRVTGR